MTTEEALVLLPLIYQMGAAIEDHRWPDALALVDQLLHLCAPLASMVPDLPDTRAVLVHKVTLMELAERQASKHRH